MEVVQKKIKSLLVLIAASSLCFTHVANSEPRLFRYTNDEGVLVTTYVLPPEFVDNGYEIITPLGDVLEVVPPAPSLEERIALHEQALSAEEQRKLDKQLLLRYGSLRELESAEARKLGELQGKITVLEGNISNIQSQIEQEQYNAAGFERQGKDVPNYILTNLETLYGSMERTEELMRKRQQELDDETLRFQVDIKRYKELKGIQ